MITRYVPDLGRHAGPCQVDLLARPAGEDVPHSWPLIATRGLEGRDQKRRSPRPGDKNGAPPVLGKRHTPPQLNPWTELASLVGRRRAS